MSSSSSSATGNSGIEFQITPICVPPFMVFPWTSLTSPPPDSNKLMITRSLIVAALLVTTGSLAAQAKPPWKAGDPPPILLGLHLGDSLPKLNSVMGRAGGTQQLGDGVAAYSYQGGNIVVTWARFDGVATIDLKSRDAGAIGGFRVGDSIDSLLAHWGPPPQGEGSVGLYVFGPWAVVVRSDSTGKRITMLTLGRVA